MTAVYAEDCACEWGIRTGQDLNVRHYQDEAEACATFLWHRRYYWSALFPTGDRYWSIHGPGGHVLGVRP